MSDAPPPMPAHLARPSPPVGGTDRARQGGFVAIALGIGLLAFAFVDGDQRGGPDDPRPGLLGATTEATVLGVTVEPGDVLPPADPAAPATFDVEGERSTSTTRRAASGPDIGAPTSIVNTTTTNGPDIGTPTSIVNTTTTTTTEATTTSSTTEPTTTTSEPAP